MILNRMFVVALVVALWPSIVCAQLGYTTYSIEWLVGSSDAVLTATISDVQLDDEAIKNAPIDPLTKEPMILVTLTVTDRFKGESDETVRFRFREGVVRHTLVNWHREKKPIVWFLVENADKSGLVPRGEFIIGDSAVQLEADKETTVARPILTASLEPLETGTEILSAIRRLSSQRQSRKMTASESVTISYNVARLTGRAGDANRLIVPEEPDGG